MFFSICYWLSYGKFECGIEFWITKPTIKRQVWNLKAEKSGIKLITYPKWKIWTSCSAANCSWLENDIGKPVLATSTVLLEIWNLRYYYTSRFLLCQCFFLGGKGIWERVKTSCESFYKKFVSRFEKQGVWNKIQPQ